MTSADWNAYRRVRLNVVAWPPSQHIGRGRVRTTWELETLVDLPLETGSSIDLAGISRDMDFTATVTGQRTMTMLCTCDENMAHPYRLGSASLAWRFIDENCARLWMIGDSPRVHYSGFMRQRREMVDQLVPSARSLWLWLSMIRAEPLFSAIAAEESRVDKLLESMRKGELEPNVIELFSSLVAKIAASAGRPVSASPKLSIQDMGALLTQAFEAAVNGTATGSVDLMAAATERLFDALLLVDDAMSGKRSSTGFAAEEDLAWFADCKFLESLGRDGLTSVIDRSRRVSARLSSDGLESIVL